MAGAILDLGDSFYAERTGATGAPATLDPGDGTAYAPNPVLSAITTGLTDIPLAGTLFERLLTQGVGVDKGLLEEMARVSNSTPYGKGLRFATELGGEMLLTGGVYALGRNLAVAGLRHAVPAGMAALAAPAANAGRMGRQLGQVAARGMDQAGGSAALRALGMLGPVAKPALERGTEILGGALGVGSVYGAAALAEGKGMGEALHQAAYAAALSGAFETAFTVGAKAIFPGAREIDVNKLLARTEFDPQFKQLANSQLGQLTNKLTTLHAELVNLHGVPNPDLSKITRVEQKIARASAELTSMTGFHDMSPLFRAYFREAPRDRAGAVQTFLMRMAKTPDQMAGEMGPATGKVVELAKRAQAGTTMARSLNNVELREIDKLARKGQGVRFHGRKGDYLLDPLDVWQKTGNAATSKTVDARSTNQAFNELDKLLQKAEFDMTTVGLTPPRHVSRSGTREFPLVLDRLDPTADLMGKVVGRPKSEEQLVKELAEAMVKSGTNSVDAAASARRVVFGDAHRTPIFNSSKRTAWSLFDETSLNALFPGKTFKEVVELGAPVIKDPIVAAEAYLNSAARRISYTKAFGVNGRLAYGPMRAAAAQQGASLQLYDHIVEGVLGSSYGTVAEQAMAAAIVNTQTATRMGLGVLPNMVQPINIPLLTGPQAFVKGLFSLYRKGPVKEAAEASAIGDSLIRGWRETFLDPYTRTPAGRFADSVLLGTGFTWRERWNRKLAFHAGSQYAAKNLVKAAEGRLRGRTLDIARRRFQGMGQDLDELTRLTGRQPGATTAERVENLLMGMPNSRGVRNMDLLKEIGMGAVRQTQFLPDKTRLPTFWNTPAGRVLFQFKSFALNQARLVRDQVVNEAAKGNLGPLLYMMGSFPIAGEMVQDLRTMIREGELNRPESGLARMVENAAAVGGFGLAGDLYRAAGWGPEQVYRSLVGPTVEDGAYALNAIVSQDFGRVVDRANRLPTYQAALTVGTVGLGLALEGTTQIRSALEQYLTETEAETQAEAEEVPSLRDLQRSGQQGL